MIIKASENVQDIHTVLNWEQIEYGQSQEKVFLRIIREVFREYDVVRVKKR